jgi:hypothetical protein
MLELVMQQLLIQLLQLITHFYWNEKFDSTLMDILKIIGIHRWRMLSHCSTLLIIKISLKKILQFVFNTYKCFLKNNTNVHVNEILFNPFASFPLSKF